jgi:cation:H+ antiporter
MIISLLFLALGIVLLIKSADWLVTGSCSLARRFHMSEIAIGLTLVAFGTSAPELVVNLFAAHKGLNEIVFGNVIGSNIANILVVLGIAGLISPVEVQKDTVSKEIPFSFGAVLILFMIVNDRHLLRSHENLLSRWDGALLLLLFALFSLYVYSMAKVSGGQEAPGEVLGLPVTFVYIVVGLLGLFIGGQLVVDNAVSIARKLGVSDKLIALTIVAIGTSLPELATSAVAAYKKKFDIAVGNIIGSGIFNILWILGLSAMLRPVVYLSAFNADIMVLFLATLLLFVAMFTGKKRKLDRWEAAIFLMAYVGYVVFLIIRK